MKPIEIRIPDLCNLPLVETPRSAMKNASSTVSFKSRRELGTWPEDSFRRFSGNIQHVATRRSSFRFTNRDLA